MKELISTNFFRALRESSQIGVNANAETLEREYDNFAEQLLSLGNTSKNRISHHNTLVYTRAELASLMGVSGVRG